MLEGSHPAMGIATANFCPFATEDPIWLVCLSLDTLAHIVNTIRLSVSKTRCSTLHLAFSHSHASCLSVRVVIFETLKKRRRGVYRAVPVPQTLLETLDMVHGLREAHKRHKKEVLDTSLWGFSRVTAWRHVSAVMSAAGIEEGPHRCPKGLRHGYAIHALSKAVPLNLVSKWMGHAKMETTAIYANAVGEEQQNIAARMWT